MASLQRWLGARPDWQVILFLGLLTVALRLITFQTYPYPPIFPADSTANMLGAHTFAQGRLTNPPAPWNQLFVLDYPTRMMKYQPAMAGFMALGIKLFGHPYWGVVLLMSLACAAGYWALRGWLSQKIAFTGALILILIFQAPHYWIWSYWGGGHILLASFLMLGAYPRVILQHRYHAIILGLLGLVLALLSRPFEGGILAISLAACGIFTMIRNFSTEQKKVLLRSIWLPTLIILGSYASFQLYYNYRITGDAFKLPYMLYHEKFEIAPLFSFEKPNYRNAHGIGNLHKFQLTMLAKPHSMRVEEAFTLLSGIIKLRQFDYLFLDNHLIYALGILLHLPLLYMLCLLFFSRHKWPYMLPLLVSSVASCIGFELMYWSVPHYMAPYFAALYVSLFVALDDLKLHPRINWLLALFAITILVMTHLL